MWASASFSVSGNRAIAYDPKRRKYVTLGSVVDGVFTKTVESKHFMLVVNGYGIQYDAFRQFDRYGIRQIVIHEKKGSTWSSWKKDWETYGSVADYGHGKQIFLSLKYMHRDTKLGISGSFSPEIRIDNRQVQIPLL